MDKMIHGIAAEGTVRVLAATTTGMVAEAIRRHGTSPTVSAALGRMLTGTLLLGSTIKDFDRLTVKVECDGPVGAITAEATKEGTVRGFVKDAVAEPPLKENGKFDVAGIVGSGTFYVIREAGFDIGFRPEPYVGSVPIVSGEIAEDFAYYLANSEQIPSAVMLGVLLGNTAPFVTAAGGIMIQMMPGANEHIITMIEDTVRHAPHVTEMIREGATPADLAKMALGIIDFEVLEEREVSFACTCSFEKAVAMVAGLGRKEVEAILAEDKQAVMTCGFCNETYRLNENDLRQILENYGKDSV
ncbi:MAG: Hsp33 family molecular chaperone HslO [Acidobacteria bacterium]|nr:Hsp33 family molecular chaperone HslO [Acidobacteriota bacterium]